MIARLRDCDTCFGEDTQREAAEMCVNSGAQTQAPARFSSQ